MLQSTSSDSGSKCRVSAGAVDPLVASLIITTLIPPSYTKVSRAPKGAHELDSTTSKRWHASPKPQALARRQILPTLNPQPSTLNPQPSTLNPQPSTLNRNPNFTRPPRRARRRHRLGAPRRPKPASWCSWLRRQGRSTGSPRPPLYNTSGSRIESVPAPPCPRF